VQANTWINPTELQSIPEELDENEVLTYNKFLDDTIELKSMRKKRVISVDLPAIRHLFYRTTDSFFTLTNLFTQYVKDAKSSHRKVLEFDEWAHTLSDLTEDEQLWLNGLVDTIGMYGLCNIVLYINDT
jgi:hypothetical protein